MEEVRSYSKSYVIISVFYVIAGVVLLFWPDMSIELFSRGLGIGLLVWGLAHIVIYFTKDHISSIMNMDLTTGVICGAFGAFLLLHPEFILTATPFAVGILLLMGSIMKLQNSIDLRRLKFEHWKVILTFAILLFFMGAILIYNPFEGHALVIYIGIALILEGVLDIIAILCISHRLKILSRKKKAQPPQPGNREYAEIVDMEEVDEAAEKQELELKR